MNKQQKLSLFFFSLALVSGGLFVKLQSTASLDPNPTAGLVAGETTNLLAEQFPDVPLYPKAQVASFFFQKGGSFQVTLETPDSATHVKDFYEKRLKEIGWQNKNQKWIKGRRRLSWQISGAALQTVVVLNLQTQTPVPTK